MNTSTKTSRAIDLKWEALATLREIRSQFFDPEYLALLEQANAAVRTDAGKKIFAVERAYQTLLAERIDHIRSALEENAADLKHATKSLKKKVKKLDDLKAQLDGVNAFLKALGSVINLVL